VPSDTALRSEIIHDDDEIEGNDAVQSDFVRVALSLGFLNDPRMSFEKDKMY
jgi:hypothetical protein